MRDYVDRRLDDHCKTNGLWQEAHLREHEHMAEQVRLARENLEIRLDALNEWKDRSIEDRLNFITKAEYESKHQALELAARGMADKQELMLSSRSMESRSEMTMLKEKQDSTTLWIRNLMIAVILLLIGVTVDLVVMLVNWRM